MLSSNSFFKNFSFEKKVFNKNINQTKKIFKSFQIDLENFEIPMLESYYKSYNFDFSQEVIKKFSKFENIIIIGMGGSILGAKSIYSFFRHRVKKKIFFFDNLDSSLNLQYSKIRNLKNSCYIIISKSGNTLETIVNLNIIFSKHTALKKIVFITEAKDSSLIEIANNFGAEIIEHKEFIGGRYSVLSETGMFPAALMGFNIQKFKNLEKLVNDKKFVSSLIYNVASIYTLNKQNIKNSVILNYDSDLQDLSYWYQQLIGESLGKDGKGITPIISTTPKDHHSVLQLYLDGPKDKFFTFFSSKDKKDKYKIKKKPIPASLTFLKNKRLNFVINAQCKATQNIFKRKNIPYRYFVFNKEKEEELGMIFTFFVLETILLARLMHVDPFNQPAVEQIKKETKKILLK